jgi:hypothetical protein
MLFTLLVALTAFLIAGSAAYFSVIGIATLFSGHFTQVLIMAGSLELGKIVATSYLYRYWTKTTLFLKVYLAIAVLALMGITSLGIYGYLSSGYQVNRGKTELVDNRILLVEKQKENLQKEITQNNERVNTLNEARKSQEARLPSMSRRAAAPVYEDMARSAEEIKSLTQRSQELQTQLFAKDNELIEMQGEIYKMHDIGTFKFVAETVGLPLDTVVKVFILIIVLVFDPLAIALILAYNTIVYGGVLRNKNNEEKVVERIIEKIVEKETPTETPTSTTTSTATVESKPFVLTAKGHIKDKR